MQQVGSVLSLFISENKSSQTIEKSHLQLDHRGIIHDKHYNKQIERSILITSLESYTLLKTHHIYIPYGTLGENLLIDFNPYHLLVGTKLSIGEVLLEITQNCTLCKHLAVHDKRIPKLLKNDRGVFAKTLKEGKISMGDTVSL